MEELLKVQDLKKTFQLTRKQRSLEKTKSKVRVAVDGLSFTAYKGEIFGLLGPNGAGKTTTLRILATLLKPDEGNAFLDGYDIIDSPQEVRARIGFLTSENKLEEFFTPRYLFDFFSELYAVPHDIRDARRSELFARFGIDEFAEVKVANLSTGMKQKVSLVISLVHDPDVIVFDEPTNGLDVLTARVVTDFLLELRERGKSILLSTHIFSLVEKVCDRVGIIIDGRMVAEGTLAEVIGEHKSVEDAFFALYASLKGGDAV